MLANLIEKMNLTDADMLSTVNLATDTMRLRICNDQSIAS